MNKRSFDYRNIGHIQFTMTSPESEKVPSLLKCVLLFLLRFLYYIIKGSTHYPKDSEQVFVSQSINNWRSLEPITCYLNKGNWRIIQTSEFPSSLIYLYSISSLIQLLSFYSNCSAKDQKCVRRVFNEFALSQGYYRVYKTFLRESDKIRVIIVANDHSIPIRCLIKAANETGLPIVYTQHASITEKFPSLQFSYSFLDGQESLEKYQAIGNIRGTIILLGSPRFDDVLKKRQFVQGIPRDAVGIGLNELDSIEKALQLCLIIQEKLGKTVCVRPHPRTMKTFDCSKFTKHGIQISDSSKESSFDFFTHISVLIANESGIHLDAAIFRIPTALFNFSDNPVYDWYGYIRTGLMAFCKTKEEVINFIKNGKSAADEKVQYYYAAYNTKYDGHIAETMAGFIETVSDNDDSAIRFLRDRFYETSTNVFSIK